MIKKIYEKFLDSELNNIANFLFKLVFPSILLMAVGIFILFFPLIVMLARIDDKKEFTAAKISVQDNIDRVNRAGDFHEKSLIFDYKINGLNNKIKLKQAENKIWYLDIFISDEWDSLPVLVFTENDHLSK